VFFTVLGRDSATCWWGLFLASLPFFYAGRRGVSLRLLLIVTLVSVAVNGVWVGIVKTHRWSPLWTLVTGFGGGFVIGWPVQVLDGMEATLAWFAWVCSYMGLSGFIGLGIERLWRLRSFPGASQTAQQPFGGMQDREGVGPVCLLRPDVGVVVGEFELLCGRGRGLLSVFLDGGVRCDVGCSSRAIGCGVGRCLRMSGRGRAPRLRWFPGMMRLFR
jgi:hypothetical protein